MTSGAGGGVPIPAKFICDFNTVLVIKGDTPY